MKSIKNVTFLIIMILFSLSCAFFSKALTTYSSGDGISLGGGSGPNGFMAKASPYGSVKLEWDGVDNAQIYILAQKAEGRDNFIPVMAISGSQTHYEDFLAPKESKLTYRVQTVSDNVLGGYSTADVKTTSVLPNPLKVQVAFADDQTVIQSIGSEGGSMSLTDQNGVVYNLQVPAGAVQADTDFTLTPVTDVQVWPLDGANLGSVRIGPENLDLYADPTLTITLPDGFPKDGTIPVGYGFDGAGDEFHLFPAAATTDGKSTQTVKKAGSQGVGTGSKIKIIEFAVGHWLTQIGVNLNQLLVAQQLADADLLPLPAEIPSNIDPILQDNDTLLAQRQLDNLLTQIDNSEKENNTDCASAMVWYDTASGLFGQAGNKVNPALFQSAASQELMGSLNDAISKVVTNGISECENSQPGNPPAERSCVQKLVTKLQAADEANGLFTASNGGFKTSDLQDFQNTLSTSCSSNPGYRLMPGEGGGFGFTQSPDPICDLNQPFAFTLAGTEEGEAITATFAFNPPGTFQQQISVMGCTADATGTYTLQVSEDGSQAALDWSIPSIFASCPEGGITVPIPPLTSSPSFILVADPTASCP